MQKVAVLGLVNFKTILGRISCQLATGIDISGKYISLIIVSCIHYLLVINADDVAIR